MPLPRHALLLTAGLGTRLRPLTLVRAKAAIPVGGEPLARRIALWLAGNGVTDLVANLHHLPATLTAVLGDGSDLGVRVRYSWEQPQVLGSAGGPRQALAIIGAESFLAVNGDTLTDVDLSQLAAAHAASSPSSTRRALVTLALVPNREPLRYGGVSVDDDGAVIGFVPRGPAATGSFHFIGVQMVEAAAFRTLPAGRPLNSIGGVYDELIAGRPGSIRAFVSDAAFWDIGTVGDYWRTWFEFSGSSTAHGQSIVWDDVQIGEHSELEECIVTDGVVLPPGSRYRRQILVRTAAGEVSATLFEPTSID